MHERYPQAANGSFSGVIRTIDGAEVADDIDEAISAAMRTAEWTQAWWVGRELVARHA